MRQVRTVALFCTLLAASPCAADYSPATCRTIADAAERHELGLNQVASGIGALRLDLMARSGKPDVMRAAAALETARGRLTPEVRAYIDALGELIRSLRACEQ